MVQHPPSDLPSDVKVASICQLNKRFSLRMALGLAQTSNCGCSRPSGRVIIALPGAVGFIVSGWGVAALPQASAGHVNLLVMGAYGHSRIRSLIIGSTTSEMIRSCLVPVMLFR